MKVTEIAIRRPVTVSMFVVAVILFGVVSLDRLALNLLPDISYPSLTIQQTTKTPPRKKSSPWSRGRLKRRWVLFRA